MVQAHRTANQPYTRTESEANNDVNDLKSRKNDVLTRKIYLGHQNFDDRTLTVYNVTKIRKYFLKKYWSMITFRVWAFNSSHCLWIRQMHSYGNLWAKLIVGLRGPSQK